MFSFFSRKQSSPKNALSHIGIDMHNHLLPGIDDGSPDSQTSLLLAEGLHQLGYTKMICTPHILSDLYPNNPSTIAHAHQELSAVLNPVHPQFSTLYAAEYMVDYDFEAIVNSQNVLFFGKEKYVLIEMSYLVESPNLRKMIFELLTKGYQPILAHPERYGYLHHRFNEYEEIRDAGCYLQINILSLIGYYGPDPRKIAEKLIDHNLIQWVGTDMHHLKHLEALNQLAVTKKAMNYLARIRHLKNAELITAFGD